MFKMKKILASLLAVAMMASIGSTVMASEVEGDYVVTYSAEEVTDTNVLLEMAKSEQFNEPEKALEGQLILPRANINNVISDMNRTVYQVLEKRLYSNGVIEEERVATSLITTRDVSTGSGSGNSVYATNKLYYTLRQMDPSNPWWGYQVLAHYASTTIVNKLSSHSVWFYNSIHVSKHFGGMDWSASNNVYSPSVNTEYYVYPNGSPEYISVDDGAKAAVYSGCEVYVNNQYTFTASVRLI